LAAVRVAFLIDRWQPERGGAERAMAALAEHLEQGGHEVVALGRHGPTKAYPAPGRFESVRVPAWTYLSRAARERALGAALLAGAQEAACDVTIGVRHLPRVDLYWPHGGSHAATLAALMRARAFAKGDPIPPEADVEQVAVDAARGRHRTFLELERRLLEGGGARRIVCVSEVVERELVRMHAGIEERLVVIENGVDTARFHPRERAAARETLLAAIGEAADGEERGPILTLVARNPELKGLPVLLEALKGLRERPWHLVVAGAKDARRWKAPVKRAELEGRVTLAANLDPIVLAAGADLSVLPSWRDPAPLAVLEALSAGTPVVTTSVAGGSELIEGGVSGDVVATPGDVEGLRGVLAAWIERLSGAEPDRDAIRTCVRGRDRAQWLGRLEALVTELAEARSQA
jgi:UDP-glucose:(heptosyl)LPS alpha-1,3-glucosyltransferase